MHVGSGATHPALTRVIPNSISRAYGSVDVPFSLNFCYEEWSPPSSCSPWAFSPFQACSTLSLKKCPVTGNDVTFDTYSNHLRVILEPDPLPMDVKARNGEKAKAIMDSYENVRGEVGV